MNCELKTTQAGEDRILLLRKVCDIEVKIVTFVVKGSAQLTVTLDRQK